MSDAPGSLPAASRTRTVRATSATSARTCRRTCTSAIAAIAARRSSSSAARTTTGRRSWSAPRPRGSARPRLSRRYHEHFDSTFRRMGVAFDHFGMTDGETNHRRTRAIVRRLQENGHVYAERIRAELLPELPAVPARPLRQGALPPLRGRGSRRRVRPGLRQAPRARRDPGAGLHGLRHAGRTPRAGALLLPALHLRAVPARAPRAPEGDRERPQLRARLGPRRPQGLVHHAHARMGRPVPGARRPRGLRLGRRPNRLHRVHRGVGRRARKGLAAVLVRRRRDHPLHRRGHHLPPLYLLACPAEGGRVGLPSAVVASGTCTPSSQRRWMLRIAWLR